MPTRPHLHYRPPLFPAALLLVLFPTKIKVQMAGTCLREEEILYNFGNQEVKHISEAALLGKSQLSWPMTKILILPFSVNPFGGLKCSDNLSSGRTCVFVRSVLGENGDGAPRAAVLRIDSSHSLSQSQG